ncbi:LacI family DNA-binding transcriptional regulator [Flavobacteriaceae bacterium S356]|uniref:LacI family DNA-binding transcriptional regulator n=1 Tax=Asprobacillus argus TaxID=3076534 RepID=A0ABU3LCN4_9FLAO|nr:LacI family DNA-binding transcriptional regulator [Flavobacteriaceae bacterium S356]
MFSGVTLKQISNLSGYSVSTVSKALNNRHDIKESTRSKIQKIASKNNYVPNNSARALRDRRTKVIAVIVPKLTIDHFNIFVCEIQKKAFAIGYRVMVLQSFNDAKTERACVHFVNDGSVDGILMLSNTKFKNVSFKTLPAKRFITIPFNKARTDANLIKKKALKSFEQLFAE